MGDLYQCFEEVVNVDLLNLVMSVELVGVRSGWTVYTPVYTCQPLWRAFLWMLRRSQARPSSPAHRSAV